MTSSRCLRLITAALIAFLLVLVSSSAAAQPTVLKIGWLDNPSSLNPLTAIDFSPFYVWQYNYDWVISLDPKTARPDPSGLQSWTVSPNGLTITLKLKPGLKWSDGVPVTSGDVAYSIRTFQAAPGYAAYFSSVASVQTPNSLTTVLHLSKPDVALLPEFTAYLLPEHIWGPVGLKKVTTSYEPTLPLVGTGPYIVTKWNRGSLIELDRNPYWRGPKPRFDRIDLITYGNLNELVRAVESGEVAMTSSTDVLASLPTGSNIQTHRAISFNQLELVFNLCSQPSVCPTVKRNSAVLDLRVRQALAYALDRNQLVSIAARGQAVAPGAGGLLSPYYTAFYAPLSAPYQQNLARANALLDQAGYRLVGGVRQKGNTRLEFTLLAPTESFAEVNAAQLISQQAARVGIKINVQAVTQSQEDDAILNTSNAKPAPQFDLALVTQGGTWSDPNELMSALLTANIGSVNDSLWSSPTYDRLWSEQNAELDSAKRKALIAEMNEYVQQNVPVLPLWYDDFTDAWNTHEVSAMQPAYPATGGSIFSTYAGPTPVLAAAPATGGGGGGGSAAVIAVVVVALAALAAIGVAVTRRRKTDTRLEV